MENLENPTSLQNPPQGQGDAVRDLVEAFAAPETCSANWTVVRPKGKNGGRRGQRATGDHLTTPNPASLQASGSKLSKKQRHKLYQKQRKQKQQVANPEGQKPKAGDRKPEAQLAGQRPTTEDPSMSNSEGQRRKAGDPKTTMRSDGQRPKAGDPGFSERKTGPSPKPDGKQTEDLFKVPTETSHKGSGQSKKHDIRKNRQRRAANAIAKSAQAPARTEPSKRSRMDDTVSPRGDHKKAKLDSSRRAPVSYADIVQNDLCIAITGDDHKQLTVEQANAVKGYLEECIMDGARDPDSDFSPGFRGKPIIADGALKLWCEDDASLRWVKSTIAAAAEIIGMKVTVKRQKELTRRIRAALFIPDCRRSVEDTGLVLNKQNRWAQINSWTIYSHSKQSDNTMFLTLGIPENIVPLLMNKERRLTHNLGNVYVRFYAANGSLQDEPPQEMPSAMMVDPKPGLSGTKHGDPGKDDPAPVCSKNVAQAVPPQSSPIPSTSRLMEGRIVVDTPKGKFWRVPRMVVTDSSEEEGNLDDGDPNLHNL